MSSKPIQISAHAEFEMQRRRIRTAEVVATIRSPGQVVPSIKGRNVYQSLIGPAKRLLLRVVVKEEDDAYHVVTVYKTSKVSKYWIAP